MNTLSSHSLFHFTRSEKTLQYILLDGLRYSPVGESIPGTNLKYIVEAICFCDIPLSSISNHVEWYGSYGIGLKPSYSKRIGATPVCYVHSSSRFLFQSKNKRANYEKWALTPYLKPVSGKQSKYNCRKYYWKNFYDEKEWRAISIKGNNGINLYGKDIAPNLRALKQIVDDERSAKRKTDYYYPNKFAWDEVEYIILPFRSNISSFVSWMNNAQLPHFLQTKIITVEQILRDF